MDFILGCNYWASNAGAEMWRNFKADVVREDFKVLKEMGVSYLRVFPNWRDFQPIMPLLTGTNKVNAYYLEGERAPENPYYLDTGAMESFKTFLDICDEYGMKLIVGLITGWMSGRLFVPSALYYKNVITDPTALYFEQLFIKGFVSAFKDRDAIFAWDLGNECNCMGKAETKHVAATWTAMISNAIRAEDNTRPVVSGMHGIEVGHPTRSWQICDQAMYTDILTTHPYPYWCDFTRNDEVLSLRTTMHATAQNKFYAECGGKPCLAEEIGTMGPMIASDEAAAKFLRTNFFSLWANGSLGVMWWCAHEQTELTTFPYTTNMVERELGMLKGDRSPKPVALEMKRFNEFLKSVDFELPEAKCDATCILSLDQEQWGVCYTSHILAKQAGLNLRFAYAEYGIPDASVYLLPSTNSITVMHSTKFDALLSKVYNGAKLYISMDNVVMAGFDKFAGIRVLDSFESPDRRTVTVNGQTISFNTTRTFRLESVGAEVLANDSNGYPCITKAKFGKGEVWCVAFPLEAGLISGHDQFSGNENEIYKLIFDKEIKAQPIRITGKDVAATYHFDGDTAYAVAVNHSDENKEICITLDGYKLSRVYYGSEKCVGAFDASVIKFKKI